MLNPRARSDQPRHATRTVRLPRINVEVLEPRKLLAAHGFEVRPLLLPFDGAPAFSPAQYVEPYFHESHQDGDAHANDASPSSRGIAIAPLLIESVQKQLTNLQVTVIETVVDLPSTGSPGADTAWSLQPSVVRPTQQSPTSSSTSDTDSAQTAKTASTGSQDQADMVNSSTHDSIEIVIGDTDGAKGFIIGFLTRPDTGTPVPLGLDPGGLERRPPTLLPGGGTPSAPASQQPAATPAVEPAIPAMVSQGPAPAVAPPASPAATSSPVLTPLAMTPPGANPVTIGTASSASVPNPATQVVIVPVSHQNFGAVSSTSEQSQDSHITMTHALATVASIVPGAIGSESAAIAASSAVQLATGVVQPTATIVEKAGDLIANPHPENSLRAAVAYNFIRLDATVFDDAVSVFAADLATLNAPSADAKHSNTRAWIITGVVVGFDAVFLGYWYRKSKRERPAKAYLLASE